MSGLVKQESRELRISGQISLSNSTVWQCGGEAIAWLELKNPITHDPWPKSKGFDPLSTLVQQVPD
jgi:hypothetical protein